MKKYKRVKKNIQVVVVSAMSTVLFGCKNGQEKGLVLKKTQMNIEYGENVSTNVKNYLNIEKSDKDLMSQAKLDLTEVKNEEGKEYPGVGEYKVVVSAGEEKYEVKVTVKDTTKPTFTDFKNKVSFMKDCKPSAEEFSSMFKTEDLSKVTVTVDDSKVDYSKIGEYEASVKAVDESGNELVYSLKVEITDATIKLNKEKASLTVGESLTLKAEVTGKDEKVVYKSSDTKIATVDAKGKVVAKAKGNVVITAEANGVKAECKVTVNANATNNTTTTKPSTGGTNNSTNNKPDGGTGHNSGGLIIPDNPEPKPEGYVLSKAKEAFNEHNKERVKVGLPALKWNDQLYEYAKIRAEEITRKCSHTRPDGSKWNSMVVNRPDGSMGENFAIAPTVERVMAAWMNSPTHKAAILGEEFNYCAIAYYNGHWVAWFSTNPHQLS